MNLSLSERIGLIIVREIERNLKPENMGRLLEIARSREINEKGRDVYVSATLIAMLGFSYETLLHMAKNEQHLEDVKEGKILQSVAEGLAEKEEQNDAS
tara:strand:+ start:658 stop:954 length:297 start_codon:yes stop_codon:yes gene_type:complete